MMSQRLKLMMIDNQVSGDEPDNQINDVSDGILVDEEPK